MTPQERGAPLAALAERSENWFRRPLRGTLRFVSKTAAIAELEARKLRHDPTELVLRGVQPLLWLLVFGQVFTRMRAIPTGNVRYLDFLAPGILAQSVLFIAIFYGIAVIWERDLGIVQKFLVSPTPRTALVLGKALAAGVRGLTQGVIIYLLALILGVKLAFGPLHLMGLVALVLLAAAIFSTFSLIIACIIKTRERFMGIAQVLTMPLFFASSAIYPISVMPSWLKVIAHGNPLTYEVDGLRSLMLANGVSHFGIATDFGVMLGAMIVLVLIGGRLYATVAA